MGCGKKRVHDVERVWRQSNQDQQLRRMRERERERKTLGKMGVTICGAVSITGTPSSLPLAQWLSLTFF